MEKTSTATIESTRFGRNPLVVALDVPRAEEALRFVDQLRGLAGMFKVGKQLFTAAGPEIVRRIRGLGEEVFLDLKFHDIPNTVASAGIEAARLGVRIFNVHALGGRDMMLRTADAVREASEREGLTRPMILGVTVLTSHTQASLDEIGIGRTIEEEVASLARLCAVSGMDGVVASPLEIRAVRQAVDRPDFVVLVPGVRPAGSSANDQSRVMTPREAIDAGASFIVVGRPIIADKDPVGAARRIMEEIEQNSSGNV